MLSALELHALVSCALFAVMSLPVDGLSSAESKKEERYEEFQEQSRLTGLTFNALQILVAELLLRDLTQTTLEQILSVSKEKTTDI